MAVRIFCTWAPISFGALAGRAIASLGSGSEVQMILLLSSLMRPLAIMALRLRSKSVAMSTWPELTAISLAGCVAPSLYFQ